MKIKLTKSTIVDGKQKKAGWSGEVSFSEASSLISMGKAVSEELETTAVNLKLDIENTEAFKELTDAHASLTIAKKEAEDELDEANNYILQLNNDIHTLTLKELRAKYPLEEQSQEQSNES